MAEIVVKRNDRLPAVAAILKQAGVIIDLTGCTVKFVMKPKNGATVIVSAAATIVSPTAGTVRYDWGVLDTVTGGEYSAEFEITTAGGLRLTCPNDRHLTVSIVEDLG